MGVPKRAVRREPAPTTELGGGSFGGAGGPSEGGTAASDTSRALTITLSIDFRPNLPYGSNWRDLERVPRICGLIYIKPARRNYKRIAHSGSRRAYITIADLTAGHMILPVGLLLLQ